MKVNRVMQVVIAPVVSEKSTMIGEKNNQYAFRVMQDATKGEVKSAIETRMFSWTVFMSLPV